MPSRIEDYAIIGDCQTVALVAKDGSIDWLCFPRFDSPACLAALLGTPEHGRWLLAPDEPVKRVTRSYRPGTLILETTFETEGGAVTVVDFMPPRGEAADLVRIAVGTRGRVKMRTELAIRFDYGSIVPWVRRTDEGRGIRAIAGPDTLHLRADVPLHGEDLRTHATFVVGEGDRVHFDLAWQRTYGAGTAAPARPKPDQALRDTERFWHAWSARCTFHGEWRDPVQRSLITLKALTYAPTGGVVAAATTSLPEHIGGVRNWDYRLCWLRDASFTFAALLAGGYTDEAQAWREWLINAVAGSPAELQIMYGLRGERRLSETELPWLPGYENSKPVRVGNDAHRQHQLDVYGEVMDALHRARCAGLPANDDVWRVQRTVVNFLLDDWHKPDEGIWEVRGPRRHFTHSKVMAWVAFDRAVKDVEQFGQPGDAARWRAARDAVRAQVMAEGFKPDVNAFTQHYGTSEPDASLLVLPMVGFIDARDPKMRGTVKLVQDVLLRDGFVCRYVAHPEIDGLPAGEGVFLMCTFWLADNLALQGRTGEARDLFGRLLSLRNDVGLLAEEYDPKAKRMVGNFPQAFSHVGLINTAQRLGTTGGAAKGGDGRAPVPAIGAPTTS